MKATFNDPTALAAAPDGGVFVADTKNHRIRKIAASGVIATAAGTGAESAGDGGPAFKAQLDFPAGLALEPGGALDVYDGCYRPDSRPRPSASAGSPPPCLASTTKTLHCPSRTATNCTGSTRRAGTCRRWTPSRAQCATASTMPTAG